VNSSPSQGGLVYVVVSSSRIETAAAQDVTAILIHLADELLLFN